MTKTTQPKPINPIDQHIGSRVRMRRKILGISQAKLGEELHISYQQVQKYEYGINRIGASRLQQIAQFFDVPVTFFFDGVLTGMNSTNAHHLDLPTPSQALLLTKAFMHIQDDAMRRLIIELVMRIAGAYR